MAKTLPVPGQIPGAGSFVLDGTAATVLDLAGLKCPLPVLRTRRAMRGLPAGATLIVVCTDPMAAIDIPNLVREEGGRMESAERVGDDLRFTITVFAKPPHS